MDTGTPALRSRKKNLTSIPAVKEQQLLEQLHVLLVLEQGAIQRRGGVLFLVAAPGPRREILGYPGLYPIQELDGGRRLLQTPRVADPQERRQRLSPAL